MHTCAECKLFLLNTNNKFILCIYLDVHYYYNIPRCKIGGGLQLHKEPVIRGPLIFAVDEQCDNVYYFTEGKGWSKYISARNLTCSRHGNECFKDSIDRSFLTFQFFSGNLVSDWL